MWAGPLEARNHYFERDVGTRSSCLCLWQQNRMFFDATSVQKLVVSDKASGQLNPVCGNRAKQRFVEAVIKAERMGVTSMCPHSFGRVLSKHKQCLDSSSAVIMQSVMRLFLLFCFRRFEFTVRSLFVRFLQFPRADVVVINITHHSHRSHNKDLCLVL